MPLTDLAALLREMGLPETKVLEMAEQLDRRARQLAAREGQNYEATLAHLLNLIRQGWAANKKNFQCPP